MRGRLCLTATSCHHLFFHLTQQLYTELIILALAVGCWSGGGDSKAAPLLAAGAATHGSLLGLTAFEPGPLRLIVGGMPWGTALVGRRCAAGVVYTPTAESTAGHRSAGENQIDLLWPHYLLVGLRRCF